jgi:hypothetical protein
VTKPKRKTAEYRDGRRRFTLDLPMELWDIIEGLCKIEKRKPSGQIDVLLTEALTARGILKPASAAAAPSSKNQDGQ